jgi:hypothetical protein
MYILYMIFICIYHPSLWTFTCFGGAPCLIVYAPVYPATSKKVGKLVRFKQKRQKQASFLAFHKCILYMIFICIYHPSLWTFTCFGGAPCLIVYAPESHTLSNYRVRLVSGKKKKYETGTNVTRTTKKDGWYIQIKIMYNIYIVRLPCRLSVL